MKYFMIISLFLFSQTNLKATGWSPQYGSSMLECVHCRYYQNYMGLNPYQNTGMNQVFNYYSPWWHQYAAPRYNHFNRPSPWMQWGMNGHHYPHQGGGAMAGKPNVYIYGENNTEFSIEFKFSEKSNLLSAVPSYKNSWKGTISNNGILHDKAFYRYYYYDYALDLTKLQWERGKCMKDTELMSYLNDSLKAGGFRKNEIDDFNEYWSYKMPPGDSYCVYPQGNQELKGLAELKIEPSATINRILFFIVPQVEKNLKRKISSYRKPNQDWKPNKTKSREKLVVNEWGVGWLDQAQLEGASQ